MTLADSAVHGTVNCVVVTDNGVTHRVGTFVAHEGYAAWSAPLHVDPGRRAHGGGRVAQRDGARLRHAGPRRPLSSGRCVLSRLVGPLDGNADVVGLLLGQRRGA